MLGALLWSWSFNAYSCPVTQCGRFWCYSWYSFLHFGRKKQNQGPPREFKELALWIAIVAGPDSNLGLTDSKVLALALFHIWEIIYKNSHNMENLCSNIKNIPSFLIWESNAFIRHFLQLCCLNVSNMSSKFDGCLLLWKQVCARNFLVNLAEEWLWNTLYRGCERVLANVYRRQMGTQSLHQVHAVHLLSRLQAVPGNPPSWFLFYCWAEVSTKAIHLRSVSLASLIRDALFLKTGLLLTVFLELSSVLMAGIRLQSSIHQPSREGQSWVRHCSKFGE